jgi:hypothetical protein
MQEYKMNEYQDKDEEKLVELISDIIEKDRERLVKILKKTIDEELIIPPSKDHLRKRVEAIAINLISSAIGGLIVKYGPIIIGAVTSVLLGKKEGDPFEVTISERFRIEERDNIYGELIRLIEKDKVEFENELDCKMFTRGLNRSLDILVTEVRAELECHPKF